jgi:hypothetical protein
MSSRWECCTQTLGQQDIYYAIREKTRSIADQHANLGRTVDGSIVQHLQKLRTEIKAHIKVRDAESTEVATGDLGISTEHSK